MSEPTKCFYCDAPLAADNVQKDHFPYPGSVGGEETVDACKTCHNMKDNLGLETIAVDLFPKIVEDFPKLSRETRIFLARAMKLIAVMAEDNDDQ